MVSIPAPNRRSDPISLPSHSVSPFAPRRHRKAQLAKGALLALAAALVAFAATSSVLRAQGAAAEISTITPNTGKADDSITIVGKNLEKKVVAAVYLSDAKLDHKAEVVDQEPTKIVIKVPALKPGDYNISVEESGSIYIQPVIFKVKT
jgi:IPT/TIG domain